MPALKRSSCSLATGCALASPSRAPGCWDLLAGAPVAVRGAARAIQRPVPPRPETVWRAGSRLQLLLHVKGAVVADGGQAVQQVPCLVCCRTRRRGRENGLQAPHGEPAFAPDLAEIVAKHRQHRADRYFMTEPEQPRGEQDGPVSLPGVPPECTEPPAPAIYQFPQRPLRLVLARYQQQSRFQTVNVAMVGALAAGVTWRQVPGIG